VAADLLSRVSRSFYLSLRVLPAQVRPQISLAYLLARASDTVADTGAVARERRLELLRRMREGDFSSLAELAPGQALPAERLLLEKLDEAAAGLSKLEAADQDLVRGLLRTIVSGQIFDLEKFSGGRIAALAGDNELDRYAYLVAGCVGEFWTKMCALHLPRWPRGDQEEMVRLGVRFGKGLQLINILRDLASDLRIGRCYLPVSEPERFLDASQYPVLRPVYERWLGEATEHLEAGWRYALMIPRSLWRVRLACIWPNWIGLETLAALRRSNPLDPAQRVKISRSKVYLILARSLFYGVRG